jgi:hypothetical protein
VKSRQGLYKRHRFPPKIIQQAVWLHHLFNLGRHLVAAGHYRTLRQGAFASWDRAVAI